MPSRRLATENVRRSTIWLRRIELFFYVVVRIYIGVILLVLPWTPLWVNNPLFNYYSGVAAVLNYGAVRGIISGLGLLNLWIALDEAIHYREKAP